MTLKLVFTASLLDVQATLMGQCGEQAGSYLYRWERHLAGFPHLGAVNRLPATPKRARIAL